MQSIYILINYFVEYLIETSKPELSRNRTFGDNNSGALNRHEIKSGEYRRVVHKTVQSWIQEVDWPGLSKYDDYVGKNYEKMNHPLLWKLDKKISLATQLKTDLHTSGTSMQVTNYGLGGLCEAHVDPVGIMEVKNMNSVQKHLPVTGDMLGTFMAWLGDTEAGGATAYISPGFEGVVFPEKVNALHYILLSA